MLDCFIFIAVTLFWCKIWEDPVCWHSSRGSKFSVRHLKMALLSSLRTPGLCGALCYTGTRSISSGTLHIKDSPNFWSGGRVSLKDVKTKSEPVYEPATGNVFMKLFSLNSPLLSIAQSIRLCPIRWLRSHLATHIPLSSSIHHVVLWKKWSSLIFINVSQAVSCASYKLVVLQMLMQLLGAPVLLLQCGVNWQAWKEPESC